MKVTFLSRPAVYPFLATAHSGMFHSGRDEFLSLQPTDSDGDQDLTVDIEILWKDADVPELPLRPAWAGPEF